MTRGVVLAIVPDKRIEVKRKVVCRYCEVETQDLRNCAVCGAPICPECRCQDCYPSDCTKRIYATMKRTIHCEDCNPDIAFGKAWKGHH